MIYTSLPWRIDTHAVVNVHSDAHTHAKGTAGQEWLTGMNGSATALCFVGANNSLTILPIVVFSPVLKQPGRMTRSHNLSIVHCAAVVWQLAHISMQDRSGNITDAY